MARTVEQNRVYMKRYYADPVNKSRKSARNKEKRENLRDLIFMEYGSKCACCGESNKKFLTIDHVNGGGTVEKKSAGKGLAYYRRVLAEKDHDKYQILCFNCNCGRSKNGGICPHKEEVP